MLKECTVCRKDKSIFTMDIGKGSCFSCRSSMNLLSRDEVEEFKKNAIDEASKKGSKTNYFLLRLGGSFIFFASLFNLIYVYIPVRHMSDWVWLFKLSLIIMVLGGLCLSLVKDK